MFYVVFLGLLLWVSSD
jgi:hypothetical protein